ncbi:unnamed protein product, partial [Meganyctiphanes norvegica]
EFACKMKTNNIVNKMKTFAFWLLVFNSYITFSNSVSIITASNKPSRVHVSSPTYSQSNKKGLPSSIIISTSFGISNRPKPVEANTVSGDSRLQVISAVEENRGTGQIGVRDKIKFYRLECSKGRTCSSIIPARTTTPPPMRASRFSKEQLRQYFRLFNPYDKDFESRGSAPPINNLNKNERPGNKREQRHYDNYWPGSNYRPQLQQSVQSLPSRAKVVKYETLPSNPRISPELDFPTRKPARQHIESTTRPWWEEIDSVYPDSDNESDKILYPNIPPRPISRPVTHQPQHLSQHSTGKKGSWRRYGSSTVSQLDRNTGEWVKVSSSNTKLDGSAPSSRPLGTRDEVYKASAALTVLGVSDREPHSAFSDSTAHKPHTVLVQSADPDKPPHKIETDERPNIPATQSGITFTVFRPKPSTSHIW